MSDRVFEYPGEYQEYLHVKYGVKPYHPKHLKRLEAQGKRPKPFNISDRRRGILQSTADRVGESLIEAARLAGAA